MKKIADYQSRAQGFSKSVSNDIDLYQNTEIKGGGVPKTPSHTIMGKPDVSLNRVNVYNFENLRFGFPYKSNLRIFTGSKTYRKYYN